MEGPHTTGGSAVDKSHIEPGELDVPSCREIGVWTGDMWGDGVHSKFPLSS